MKVIINLINCTTLFVKTYSYSKLSEGIEKRSAHLSSTCKSTYATVFVHSVKIVALLAHSLQELTERSGRKCRPKDV